ncbi:MAG: 4-hydroxybenzoyl-CoA reductase subunit beta [Alphaproteobacteria bacterium]
MEYMPDFHLLRPETVDEAVNLHRNNPDARFLAGGTDLVVNIRRGIVDPKTVIDISAIAEIREIANQDGAGLTIGAAVTLAELVDNRPLLENYNALYEAAAGVAASTHREVATVGGNLCLDTRCVYYNQSEWWRSANNYCLKHRGDVCHVAPSGNHCFAAFSGDLAPAVMVLGGEVEIAGPDGRRTVPLGEIYADDGAAHLRLAESEILTAVTLPGSESWRSGYAKARIRDAIDFPLAGVAIALRLEGHVLEDIRVALTGTNSCPVLIAGTEELVGEAADAGASERLASMLPKQIQPMNSTFTPPGWRRKAVTNLARALFRRLIDSA